jgi:protein-S-isoprenylcysteine O-methyltransferase Ste14
MNLFAVHAFGFFNLWLLMVLYALPILLTIVFHKHVFHPTSSRFSSSRNASERRLFIVSKIIMLIYFLYAIVVPVRLDTAYGIIGLVIYGIGFAFYSAAWIIIATSEGGRVFSDGPFRFSRHPVYVSSAVLFVGAGFVSESYIFLGLSLLVGMSHMRNALAEEEICLETFGDEYSRYMANTPKWFGRPAPKPDKDR